MSDEGFHEIQLNGKQLVFLFMASTVVSVVIFLLGVMVGRGVRGPSEAAATELAGNLPDPTAAVQTSSGIATPNSDRTPVSAQESLTYAERLATPTPAPDTLKDPTAIPPVPPAEVPPPAEAAVPPTPELPSPRAAAAAPAQRQPLSKEPAVIAVATNAFREPAGTGHVVQVGAYPRNTADAIARQLASRGYPVFVTPRPQGLFAVRVGKYEDRREAETVARRLEQEEQFNKPWVTR